MGLPSLLKKVEKCGKVEKIPNSLFSNSLFSETHFFAKSLFPELDFLPSQYISKVTFCEVIPKCVGTFFQLLFFPTHFLDPSARSGK